MTSNFLFDSALLTSANTTDLANPTPVVFVVTLRNFFFLYLLFAVTNKRFHDRDYAPWVGLVWLLPFAAVIISHFFGVFFFNPFSKSAAEQAAFALLAALYVWFFVDAGFLKGTPGPNRYGDNPLSDQNANLVEGAVATHRRTIGAYIRDGITLIVALVAVSAVLRIDIGTNRAIDVLFDYLPFDDSRTVERASADYWAGFKATEEGNEASERHDYAAAIKHYSRAVDLFDANSSGAAMAHRFRAEAYEKINDTQNALIDIGEAIRLEPGNADAYRTRARLQFRIGSADLALADIEKATQLSWDASSLNLKGDILVALKRHDDAFRAFSSAIVAAKASYERKVAAATSEEHKASLLNIRDRQTALAYIDRGDLLRDQGRYDDALSDYGNAIKWDPNYYRAYQGRGFLYEKLKDRNRALADYEKAASLHEPDEWLKRAIERVR